MRATNMDELQLLINAANGWRAAGTTVGVSINQLNARMPDNTMVILFWSDEFSEWNVQTQI